jgi:Flp pilus assembly protein TadG
MNHSRLLAMMDIARQTICAGAERLAIRLGRRRFPTKRAQNGFLRDEGGGLATMFALTLIPILILTGITIDYTQSSNRKLRLDGMADSASLSAVTPAMLAKPIQASIDVATTVFNSQASLVKGVGTVTPTVTATDNGLSRTVNVSYQTTSNTLFNGFTGRASLPISGMAQASATVPPNIDFYLLLDNSPSMADKPSGRHQYDGLAHARPVRLRVP